MRAIQVPESLRLASMGIYEVQAEDRFWERGARDLETDTLTQKTPILSKKVIAQSARTRAPGVLNQHCVL